MVSKSEYEWFESLDASIDDCFKHESWQSYGFKRTVQTLEASVYFLTSTFCRQLSVVLDRELSVDFGRPLSFLQNRAPIILNRPISFFDFIHFENAKKGRIKQANLEIFEKLSFFVEKNTDFPKNREFSDFEKHRFS